MIHKFILIFLFFFGFKGFSQGLKVLISEKKTGKRIVLYAENKTKDTLNVFLMVNAEGYRRSASKPVIKNIPPSAKIPMITLIELSGVTPMYTYDLIINDKAHELSLTYEKQATDIEKIINNKLIIFTTANCIKCTTLSSELKTRRVAHRIFNINEDRVIYQQFMAFIERQLTNETKIRFPVIWNKNHVIFGYENLEQLTQELID